MFVFSSNLIEIMSFVSCFNATSGFIKLDIGVVTVIFESFVYCFIMFVTGNLFYSLFRVRGSFVVWVLRWEKLQSLTWIVAEYALLNPVGVMRKIRVKIGFSKSV